VFVIKRKMYSLHFMWSIKINERTYKNMEYINIKAININYDIDADAMEEVGRRSFVK